MLPCFSGVCDAYAATQVYLRWSTTKKIVFVLSRQFASKSSRTHSLRDGIRRNDSPEMAERLACCL